jgi:DNA repair protein SbcC/Rad50
MRPLNLRLENFACFRGRAVELDFEPLELFAIAGPTGAGKSSLLDAIIFALYGRVPRIGGRGASEIISLGADRLSVAFDFRVGADRYRVTRVVRRRSAGTAQLEKLGPGDEARPLKDGVREVDDEIAHIVGLSYDAFTQAVVLPQGEFQKFLKSRAGERREILTKILRLQIYDRMRDLASRRRDHYSQVVQQGERRLAEDYALATPETLVELNGRAHALCAEIEVLSGQLGEAETRRDALRMARGKTRELEQRRSRLLELEADEPKIRDAEFRLEAARRAAPVLPLIKAARAAEVRAAEAHRTYDLATKQYGRIQSQRDEAKKRLEQAAKDAEQIPVLAKRIAALDQIIGRMRPRPGFVKSLAEAKKQQTEIARKLKDSRGAHEKAESELATARQSLRAADEALAAVPFDAVLFDALDATREDASRIANLRTEVSKRATEVNTAKGQLKEKEVALARANAAAERAEDESNRASQRTQEIEHALIEARHCDAAAVLRGELRLGEPCPVCTQPVAEHPPALATPALDALQQKFQHTRKAEAEARSHFDEARTAAARAAAAVAAACESLDQSTKTCRAAEAESGGASEILDKRLRGLITISAERPIDVQVQDAYRLAAASRQQHDDSLKARNNAERAAQERERGAEQLSVTVKQLSDLLGQQENRIAEITLQIAEIDEEVRQVTQAPDPEAERQALIRRGDQLEMALRESRDADHETEIELSAAAARLEASEGTHKSAQQDAELASEAARTATDEARFHNEAAAVEAELSPSEQNQISEQVRTHRDERQTLETRISELGSELQGEEVAQETLDAAEVKVTGLRDCLGAIQNSRAVLDREILALTDAIKRADALRGELKKQHAEHAVYHGLALDLRSDRFQAFLLEETFRELVAGASARLWDLTKRYRFDWQNEAFQVVDHDNARQVRSADTLSGGETFLASLALALQLSEQVQHAAGATMLDSLFIDEGFGTLDPEALDAAASAIESLPVGGRMVGIITHIEELSLRLPARVKLEKASSGSRLMVETA